MWMRRFEHLVKERFFEICWEGGEVEIVSGGLGKPGRARGHNGPAYDCERFVEAEIAKVIAQGYVEVVPDVIQARSAVHVAPSEDWMTRIAAAPDDDEPRLVYADWLQSQGDPRGELIAVQCELAARELWDPQHALLVDRANQLMLLHRPRWLPGVRADAGITFARGFADRLELDAPWPAAELAALLAVTPLLRTLVLSDAFRWPSPPWKHLPDALLTRLTGLELRGFGLRVRSLVDDPRLTRVDRFVMRASQLVATDMRVLGERAWRELDVHGNTLGARGAEWLLTPAVVDAVEVLHVGSSGLNEAAVARIAEAPFARLRRLSLRRSMVTASLGALARSPHLAGLRALDLSCNVDVRPLFDDPQLPALRELDLRETALDDAGLAALAASPLAAPLAVLQLGGNRITDPRPLAALPALRVVGLSGNPLADGTLRDLRAALPLAKISARRAGP